MPQNSVYILLGTLCLLLSNSGMAAPTANWHVVQDRDVLTHQPACLLVSEQQTIHDGQTTTPMHIAYNGEAFVVVTHSTIDVTYPRIGLRVDKLPTHAIDKVHREKSAVFASNAERLRKQFSKGRVVRVALGFWPTWPKGETVETEFSLLGFHAAYRDFLTCQKAQ